MRGSQRLVERVEAAACAGGERWSRVVAGPCAGGGRGLRVQWRGLARAVAPRVRQVERGVGPGRDENERGCRGGGSVWKGIF